MLASTYDPGSIAQQLVGLSATQTITNKTINLTSNTLTATKAQFDTACSDGNFVYQSDTASTTVSGIVELATGAEALGGSDATRAVTSSGLASDKSLAANGYMTLPGNVVMQWGGYTGGASSGSVSFPKTFPTACASVVCTPGTADRLTDLTAAPSTTSFSFATSIASTGTASTVGFFWMAIGY